MIVIIIQELRVGRDVLVGGGGWIGESLALSLSISLFFSFYPSRSLRLHLARSCFDGSTCLANSPITSLQITGSRLRPSMQISHQSPMSSLRDRERQMSMEIMRLRAFSRRGRMFGRKMMQALQEEGKGRLVKLYISKII